MIGCTSLLAESGIHWTQPGHAGSGFGLRSTVRSRTTPTLSTYAFTSATGPVGHGSPGHVTSATRSARTGPAGPVAPPSGAGSRDLVQRGRGWVVSARSQLPTYKLLVTVTWRTEGGDVFPALALAPVLLVTQHQTANQSSSPGDQQVPTNEFLVSARESTGLSPIGVFRKPFFRH